MSCQDCNNCPGVQTPDSCIRYTGEAIPELSLCEDASLYEVEEALIERVLQLSAGTGVTMKNLNLSCPTLSQLVGTDPTLQKLVEGIAQTLCSLETKVAAATPQAVSFNTGCLNVTNPTRDGIIQAVVDKVCSLTADVSAIKSDYVKASQLPALIQQHNSGSGSNTQLQYKDRMVPHVAVPYFGSLSNFDASGKGLVASGFDKIYLCNGSNGTPDIRGRAVVGAIAQVPGPALDSAVDPALPQNAGMAWAINQKFGQNTVALSVAQMPAHTHKVVDPGHEHDILHGDDDATGNKHDNFMKQDGDWKRKKTTRNVTNISLESTGNSQPHPNQQPSIGAYFIMYIP